MDRGDLPAFALGTGATIYIAHRSWDGLGDRGYSEAAGVLRGAAGGQEVLLAIAPWPPGTMREVDFTVTLPGYAGSAPPSVDLSMTGMEMGGTASIFPAGPTVDIEGRESSSGARAGGATGKRR